MPVDLAFRDLRKNQACVTFSPKIWEIYKISQPRSEEQIICNTSWPCLQKCVCNKTSRLCLQRSDKGTWPHDIIIWGLEMKRALVTSSLKETEDATW